MSRANGVRRHKTDLLRIVISLDDETFGEIRARAEKQGCSFAAEARLLIEIGLETLKQDENA